MNHSTKNQYFQYFTFGLGKVIDNILEKKRPVASIASNIVRGTFQPSNPL